MSDPNQHPSMMAICASGDDFKIEAADASADGPAKPKKFSMTAYTGAAMRLAGWRYPVVASIEATNNGGGLIANRQTVPIDQNHDPERIVGHTTAIDKTQQRVYAVGLISGHHDTESTPGAMAAREVTRLAANGFPWQASIFADPAPGKVQFVDKGETVKVNGRNFTGPMYAVWESQLKAISFVANGADGNTSASVAASLDKGTKSMMDDTWIAAQGFDPKALSDAQRNFLQAAFDAQTAKPAPAPTPVPSVDDSVSAIRAATAAEMGRISEIRRICAASPGLKTTIDGKEVEIETTAIAAGWDATKTELAVLRASRAPAHAGNPVPFGYTVTQPEATEKVIEAAAMQALGYSFTKPDPRQRLSSGSARVDHVKDTDYDDKTLQAAHDLYKGRMSMQQMLIASSRLGGFRGRLDSIRSEGDIQEVLRAGMTPSIKADGFSTASLPNILSNLQNKFMLQGYWSVDSTWRRISAVRSVKDFKVTNSFNLTGDFNTLLVGADGELKHATFGEEAYTNAVDTYGRTAALTRKMIINDDLGALSAVPIKLGRGAGLGINKVFWTAFLGATAGSAISNFWCSSVTAAADGMNNNYFTGSGTTLQSSQLAVAEQMFKDQVDPNGEPLGYDPKLLLVPTSLWVTARELNNSTKVVGPTSAKTPDANIFAGMFEPITTPYLSNSRYTGYSTTAWYLLADPMDVAIIEMAFLNGQEAPTVQTFQMEPNQLGIQMTCFLDFGVSLQNKRAGVKSKGAA